MKEKLEELIKDYRAIVNQSQLMITAVNDPYDRAKIEGGKLSMELVIENLETILNEAIVSGDEFCSGCHKRKRMKGDGTLEPLCEC